MNTKSFFYLFAILGAFLLISSCVKDDFDEPPVDGEDPNLTANTTIAELKALHVLGGITPIDTNYIIEAIVVADDESGNLFKTIVIEDESAGIHVSINSTGLYNTFTVGRKVFIKCEGLVIADFAGLIQLGGSAVFNADGESDLSGIEEALLNEFVIPGVRNQPVVPKEYLITQLNPTLNSTLVQLNDVEFVVIDTLFADGDFAGGTAKATSIRDCNGSTLLVRTSTFAKFINEPVPSGKGTFVGILSSFGTTRQLLIRNIFDLDMDGERCDGIGGGGDILLGSCAGEGDGEIDEDFQTLADEQNITFPGWCNLITQGERFWRAVEFEGNIYASLSAFMDSSPFAEGWMITETINLDNPQILNFESAQNNYTHDGLSVLISTNFTGDPRAATWTELDATLAQESDSWYEFIPSGDVDLSAFSGDVNIAFKYEGSAAENRTGGFHIDNVLISEDGLGGGGGGSNGPCEGEGDGEIDEDFSNQSSNDNINFSGWCNVAIEGERLWRASEFGGNVYASAGAFNDPSPTGITWMITETVNVTTPQILNFESAQNNYTHDGLSVWISSNYTGDALAADWTELNATLAQESDSWYEFIPSGDVDLSAFSGDVNIAFRYEGSSASGDTGGFHIDNILISEDGVGGGGGGGGNDGVCEGEGDGEINEDFSSQANNEDVSFPGWCNVATTGTRLWRAREFDGNVYVQATAFQDTEPLMTAWLIMETIDVTTPKTLNFDSATAFYTNDGLSVWISSDYSGDPLAANWTQLNANLAGSSQANYDFINSGDIDLSGFTGDVNIAFRYDGGSSTGDTGTFQLDNVVISQ